MPRGSGITERGAFHPRHLFGGGSCCLPSDVFFSSCCPTVGPSYVTDELRAAVTTTLHCVSVECGTNPGPN